MKKLAMLLMLMGSPLMAQEAGVGSPIANLNISNLATMFRADFVYDQHGTKWAGLHIPLLDVHDNAGDEIMNFNGGAMWAASTTQASSLTPGSPSGIDASLTFRIDYLARKINNQHITVPMLPKIEIGPMGSYLSAQKAWLYGLLIATTFGQ